MEVQKYLKGSRKHFSSVKQFLFNGWEVFGRLRINFVDREFFYPSRIFLSIEKFPVDREIFLSIEKFPVDREITCQSRIFPSIDKLESVFRYPSEGSPGRQVETDDVSLSELIGYQIYPHKWNFCTISISRGRSPKPCGAIFLLVALQSFCQVRLSKFYRYALRLETIAGDQILDRQKKFSIGKKVLDRQN